MSKKIIPLCVLGINLISSLILSSVIFGADTQETLEQARMRAGFWVGTAVSGGTLEFTATDTKVSARIDALPSLDLGVDYWGTEAMGLYLRGAIGLGADLDLPELFQSEAISFNQHEISFGGTYRWHLSPRPLAPSLNLSIGLNGLFQIFPPQRPTYFVQKTSFGPEVGLSFTYALSTRSWVRALTGVALPLVTREELADSGELEGGIKVFLGGEGQLSITQKWGLFITAYYFDVKFDFQGFGTRAQGVFDAEERLSGWRAGIALRYSL